MPSALTVERGPTVRSVVSGYTALTAPVSTCTDSSNVGRHKERCAREWSREWNVRRGFQAPAPAEHAHSQLPLGVMRSGARTLDGNPTT